MNAARTEALAAPAQTKAAATAAERRYALMLLVVAYTFSHVDRNILGILVEPIKADLGFSDTQLGFLTGFAFATFYATLGIPIAWWADRSNRRNIIALSLAIWSAMTALSGLAQNFVQLALARIGVGIGEAGSSPPSHSMISDLYPRAERSAAMAIYALGVYFGVGIGFFMGGFVAENYGWRVAFFVAGLPGLLLALLIRLTLKEPQRGHADGVVMDVAPPRLSAGFKHLWSSRASRHLVIGVTLTSFVGYGALAWGPAFMIRSYGMTVGEVGMILSPLVAALGGIGAFAGGKLADRLARRDPRWNAWIVAVAKLFAMPLLIAFYLVDDLRIGLPFYAAATLLGAFYLGPTYAMIQSLTPLRLRAMAAAVLLFVLNLIGLGLGPQLIGILSDALRPSFGNESLRYALFASALIHLWAIVHYYVAGRHYRRELAGTIARPSV